MKPRLLLRDKMHDEALEIIKDHVEIVQYWSECPDMIYTGLTPVETSLPVFCPCTGVDHVQSPKIIHLDDEWKKGEGRQITSTAEHTWSLILQLAKLKHMSVSGKTICLIGGYGRVGLQVMKYAIAFGMKVIVIDREKTFWVMEDAERIFSQSDIVSIHVPLNSETRGMIGEEEFAMMKSGALLVNTSRAEIVDETSLLNALVHDGSLEGYADDFMSSHNAKFIDLTKYSNIILTNHIAGNSIEARRATDIYIAKKIVEYVKGGLDNG